MPEKRFTVKELAQAGRLSYGSPPRRPAVDRQKAACCINTRDGHPTLDAQSRRDVSSRRDLSLASALRARLSQRGARVVPYRHTATCTCSVTSTAAGARSQASIRWPQGGFAPTELTVKAGGRLSVSGQFLVLTGSSVVVAAGAHLSLSNGYINRGAGNRVLVGHHNRRGRGDRPGRLDQRQR